MPIDTFMVMALRHELSGALEGSRIDKIHMPARDEVHLLGRGRSGAFRLLISGGTRHARAHLSDVKKDNPATPPMFCMLLRKHLAGGRFLELCQPDMERALHFHWSAADEMGVVSRKTLVCEMMGRHSNIILVDAEGRIIDCLRRVDNEMSPERPVLPGLFYREPPRQDKQNPLLTDEAGFAALRRMKPEGQDDSDWLLDTFCGLSPALCRTLAAGGCAADGQRPSLQARFFSLMDKVKKGAFTPVLLHRPGKSDDAAAFPMENGEPFPGSFSALLDKVYTEQESQNDLRNRAAALRKQAAGQRDKLRRKIVLQEQELAGAQNREHLRECGDLLMANLHTVGRGAASVTVEDFYQENRPRAIRLDTARSPQQNAALYYKRYAKAKTAETELQKQIALAHRELEYWESVLEQIARVGNLRELQEIRDELRPPRGRQKAQKLSRPHAFVSGEGVRFWAGRNNRQNDELTMKTAAKNDIWMHTQKTPGCHVVIDTGGPEPGEQTLYEAAAVAAWYSGAKTSPKVPVDYTQAKYVKKPSGARPGFVIYDRFKTLLVEPDGALVERLRAEGG